MPGSSRLRMSQKLYDAHYKKQKHALINIPIHQIVRFLSYTYARVHNTHWTLTHYFHLKFMLESLKRNELLCTIFMLNPC